MSPNLLEPILRIVFLPISWIPSVQSVVLQFLFDSSSTAVMILKLALLLLPALLLIGGLWCTILSVYTIPFRAKRRQFIMSMLTAWWDSGRAAAMYWVGIVRALFLTAGWIWGLARIFVASLYLALVELITLPFSLFKRGAEKSIQPGVPWVAAVLMVFWALVEAGLFSYALYPTVSEIAADLSGTTHHPFLQPALFVVLTLLIAGSFACLEVMLDAVRRRDWKEIIQMLLVELFVMFVEVLFLYRELVDAITPVLAQQSGGQVRIGIAGVLLISAVAWIGVRGMTWFLFGRFGTPMLLAIISGKGFATSGSAAASQSRQKAVFGWAMDVVGNVKADIDWFHRVGRELLEAYILPPLQVVAASINFFMILFNGRQLLGLPLQNFHALVETGELLKLARAQATSSPRDSAS